MTAPCKTALEYAAAVLSIRAMSTMELQRKLYKKEYSSAEIRQVIQDFTRLGYLNDRVYAESLCSVLTSRGDGRKKIAGKLRLKGIAPEIIKEILQGLDNELPEEEAAWQSLQRKISTLNREPDIRKRKEKAVRFLAGRGFSAAAAYQAWSRFCQENCE